MHSLVYVSSATELFSRAELDEILAVSRRNNEAADAQAVPGYSQFLNSALNGPEFTEDPAAARRLLTSFKRSM